jgi:hypothetical protein
MTEGYNLSELATKLGRPQSWVSERLQSLRNELLLQTGLLFPLSDSEYASLTLSIERNGVRSPVLIGQHIACVDGRHRLLIAAELGLTDVPAIFLEGLSEETERELSLGLNAARRQLSRAQKRSIVESELMRDPARSDRLIASIAGVDHTTVGDIRREIEAQLALVVQPALGDTTTVEPAERVGRDGRVIPQPTRAPRAEPASPATRPATPVGDKTLRQDERFDGLSEELVGYAVCSHGDRHGIWKHTTFAGRYRLENCQV